MASIVDAFFLLLEVRPSVIAAERRVCMGIHRRCVADLPRRGNPIRSHPKVCRSLGGAAVSVTRSIVRSNLADALYWTYRKECRCLTGLDGLRVNYSMLGPFLMSPTTLPNHTHFMPDQQQMVPQKPARPVGKRLCGLPAGCIIAFTLRWPQK